MPLTAMLFVATTFALHRMGRAGVSRVIVDRRLLLAVMLASLTFFVQAGTASPYRRPWEWGGRDRTDQVRLTVVDVIEPGDSVRSASSVATSLAERSSLSLLDPGDRPDPEAAADGVDVVVVDEHLLDDWTAVQQRILVDGIEARGFDRVLDREGIIVLRRAGA